MLVIGAIALQLGIGGSTTGQLKSCRATPGVSDHSNGVGPQLATRKETTVRNGIQQRGDILGTFLQFLGARGRTVSREHRPLLLEVTAGVIRHHDRVAIGSKAFAPTLEGFRVIPESVGNHNQPPIGSRCGLQQQTLERFGTMVDVHAERAATPLSRTLCENGCGRRSWRLLGQHHRRFLLGLQPERS